MASTGSDMSTFVGGIADLDPEFRLIDEPRLAESCVRRLMTPKGSLDDEGEPAYGFDLTELTSARMTPVTRARIVAAVEAECRKEPRVETARVVSQVLPTAADPRLRLSVAISSAVGPFELVLGISAVTIEILGIHYG